MRLKSPSAKARKAARKAKKTQIKMKIIDNNSILGKRIDSHRDRDIQSGFKFINKFFVYLSTFNSLFIHS